MGDPINWVSDFWNSLVVRKRRLILLQEGKRRLLHISKYDELTIVETIATL
jgi:hypothetical protein